MAVVPGVRRQDGLLTFSVSLRPDLLEELSVGGSVGIDGVCLTATRIEVHVVTFDVMQQTLDATTLGQLQDGSRVNVERGLKYGMEMGGHPVSGRVDGSAEIVAIDTPGNNFIFTIRLAPTLMKYIFPKGFIALNGVSLTVGQNVDRARSLFSVSLIPETLRQTTFSSKSAGDLVNLEIDRMIQAVVDTTLAALPHLLSEHHRETSRLPEK